MIGAAYRFFREHAGYVVGRSAAGAMALARAEVFAEEHGLEFRWEIDVDAGACDVEQFVCLCVDDAGEVLASLGGIELGVNSRTDMRVFEAELACEALDVIDSRYAVQAKSLASRATFAG